MICRLIARRTEAIGPVVFHDELVARRSIAGRVGDLDEDRQSALFDFGVEARDMALEIGEFIDLDRPEDTRHAVGADAQRLYVDPCRRMIDGGPGEQRFEGGGRPAVAFCSDPFGNGFCVIGENA